jgi:hypothetical protein
MEKNDVKKVVDEINNYIQKGLWLDFEVSQYSKNKLMITGSIDPSNPHDIEINFEDVFFVSLPLEWKTDTTKTVLHILEGEDAKALNLRFQVEQGYQIFKFSPEDYPDDFGCIIGAKAISYLVLR